MKTIPSGNTVKFLEIRWSNEDPLQALALCAGFQFGHWRAEELADHLMNWLPDFALSEEERSYFGQEVWNLLKSAAGRIYGVDKQISAERGEVGELLLHVACVQEMATSSAIITVFYKSALNDNIKGFDCVHYRRDHDTQEIELWQGEAKFYTDGAAGVRDAVKSIKTHLTEDFFKEQKILIRSKLGTDHSDAEDLLSLFHPNVSIDEIAKRMHVPVLITYDSAATASSDIVSAQYIESVGKECTLLKDSFVSKVGALTLTFHLIFVPLNTKKRFLEYFDKRLGILQ